MIKIIGVRFRDSGKVYYFDPGNLVIRPGDHVIVETARGMEYGNIAGLIREVTDDKIVQPLKKVIRISTLEDDEKIAHNRIREREAMKICKEKIHKHDLEMKLIDAEYAFDDSKLLFYFTADGRIDFRELVKDLAAVFKTRIELRQIGVRDETKILGGVGICGRPLCCATYLPDFVPVSIKMAKEQNLSLNPTKISGVCGRLMCCLKNEEDTYEYLNDRLPAVGDLVLLPDGEKAEVHSVNVLRQKVRVLIEHDDEKEMQEYPVEELQFHPKHRKEKNKDREKNREKTPNTDTHTPVEKDSSEGQEKRRNQKPEYRSEKKESENGSRKEKGKRLDRNKNPEINKNREKNPDRIREREKTADRGKEKEKDRASDRDRAHERGKRPEKAPEEKTPEIQNKE